MTADDGCPARGKDISGTDSLEERVDLEEIKTIEDLDAIIADEISRRFEDHIRNWVATELLDPARRKLISREIDVDGAIEELEIAVAILKRIGDRK